MGFLNKYPYTDFHELNLDWLLNEFQQLTTKVESLDQAVQQFQAFLDDLDLTEEVREVIQEYIDDGTIPGMLQPLVDAAEEELRTEMNLSLGSQNLRIQTLEGRMDAFSTLAEGSTTGDAELIDARVAINGKIWPSAGDAIRGQANHLDVRTRDAIVPKLNLFDKTGEYYEITVDHYRNYSSGNEGSLPGWNYVTIPVVVGASYYINKNGVHVCFFKSFDYPNNYLSGVLTSGSNFVAPANAVCMTVSYNQSDEDTLLIAKTTAQPAYQPFELIVPYGKVAGNGALFVGANKAYTTIAAAIADAKDGDVIFIDSGVYNENLEIKHNGKFNHLIGSGMDSTIIRTSGGGYADTPLNASKGIFENIGFETTATSLDPGETEYAYAAHIDDYESVNAKLEFINCRFTTVGDRAPSVGIGLRENFTLRFTNCLFQSNANCVYAHEAQASNKLNQRLELIDCTFEAAVASKPIIKLQETRTFTGNACYALFQRCITNKLAGQDVIVMVEYPDNATPAGSNYLNSYCWYLDQYSKLNVESTLNA